VLASIQAIVDYDLPTEQRDYERQDPDEREGHVFEHLQRVSAWLENLASELHTAQPIAERADVETVERMRRELGS
jgi:hypothetical protein